MSNEEKILQLLENQQREIARANAQSEKNSERIAKADERIAETNVQLAKTNERLEEMSAEVARVGMEVAKTSERLAETNVELTRVSAEVVRINMTLENRVFPALEALAEGQKTILETLAPKSRVEALEDEVAFLKQMLKTLAGQVNDLKKAQ